MTEVYQLNAFENNNFNPIRELSHDEFDCVEKNIEIINNFHNQYIVYVYFHLNLLDFDSLVKKLSNIPVARLDLVKLKNVGTIMSINRIIFNLLASFKFFLDNAECHLKRNFGNDSSEYLEFQKLTNHYFDNHFEYRFLSKLRNYALHLGFPFKKIYFSTEGNKENPEDAIGDIDIRLERLVLLKETKLFGSKVSEDMMKMSENINLKPLIYQLAKIVNDLEKYVFQKHQDELETAISFCNALAKKYKSESNEISIMYNFQKTIDNKFLFNTLTIPFIEIEEIEKFKNRC